MHECSQGTWSPLWCCLSFILPYNQDLKMWINIPISEAGKWCKHLALPLRREWDQTGPGTSLVLHQVGPTWGCALSATLSSQLMSQCATPEALLSWACSLLQILGSSSCSMCTQSTVAVPACLLKAAQPASCCCSLYSHLASEEQQQFPLMEWLCCCWEQDGPCSAVYKSKLTWKCKWMASSCLNTSCRMKYSSTNSNPQPKVCKETFCQCKYYWVFFLLNDTCYTWH